MMPSPGSHSPNKPRYELKYVVDMASAERFLEGIADAVEVDPHARYDGGYQVSSLYFDTPDTEAYFEKLDGVDPRYKVRLRCYGGGNVTPERAFIEIKHRRDNRVHKDRAVIEIARLGWDNLTDDARLEALATAVAEASPSPTSAIVERLLRERPRRAMVRVSYRRQAFESPIHPSLRITLDTDLRAAGPQATPWETPDAGFDQESGELFLPPHLTILEIKFHYAMPLWLLACCRDLGLNVRRYSKYCAALEHLRPELAHRSVRLQETL